MQVGSNSENSFKPPPFYKQIFPLQLLSIIMKHIPREFIEVFTKQVQPNLLFFIKKGTIGAL